MFTRIYQDHYKKWNAKSELKIADNRVITISTRRSTYGNALITNVSVYTAKDGFLSHMLYADYNVNWAKSTPNRVTAKVVENQHNEVLADIETIKDAVDKFYKLETV